MVYEIPMSGFEVVLSPLTGSYCVPPEAVPLTLRSPVCVVTGQRVGGLKQGASNHTYAGVC